MTRGIHQIRYVWPWAGLTTRSAVVVAALAAVIVMTGTILITTSWLVHRPVFAADDAEFDLQIRLRRGLASTLVRLLYALTYAVGLVIELVDTSVVPFDVRRQSSPWWDGASMVVIVLALAGLLVQDRREARFRAHTTLPSTAASDGYLPDAWEPAPGTNGWIFFSGRERPTV